MRPVPAALLLSERNLRGLERIVDAARQQARRSADSRLPPDAGTIFAAHAQRLVAQANKAAADLAAMEVAADLVPTLKLGLEYAVSCAKLARHYLAEGRAAINALPDDVLARQRLLVAGRAVYALEQHWASQVSLLPAGRKKPEGRRADHWTAALLFVVADWWASQGWVPTTSQTGAFVLVVQRLVSLKKGRPTTINPATIGRAISEVKDTKMSAPTLPSPTKLCKTAKKPA
ncbi:MAG: hypothetical protein Q8O42_02710 [Acidobacteriota bacterium]|nr:hypothetical protein [Acidobacteriota bacterium]